MGSGVFWNLFKGGLGSFTEVGVNLFIGRYFQFTFEGLRVCGLFGSLVQWGLLGSFSETLFSDA